MIHIFLTPPNQDTTTANLGVLHIGCIPPFAQRALTAMEAEGWTISIVTNPAFDFPEDSTCRKLGLKYFDTFMAGQL